MSELHTASPLTLKCGLQLPNRLAKAALAEAMADSDQLPNNKHLKLYDAWAKGGWGMILTGNVQVDSKYLGTPADVGVGGSSTRVDSQDAWKKYASTVQKHGTPAIVQINHPGRQSPLGAGTRSLFAKTIAPSPVPLKLGDGLIARMAQALMFGTPREMTVQDIQTVVQQFASTAKTVADAGFSGVQIHAAHGYLLTQFLSSKTNKRGDEYGGSAENRARIVLEIIKAVKEAVPKRGFAVGIKLNSVDHQSESDLADCITQLRLIVDAGVDFVEISGGTYENPSMMHGDNTREETPVKSSRTQAREAFFLEFAKVVRAELQDVPLMVTGGFRSRRGIESAISSGDCDLVGLGRPSVLNPALPANVIFNKEIPDDDAVLYTKKVETPWLMKHIGIRSVGAGVESGWYANHMRKIAVSETAAKC